MILLRLTQSFTAEDHDLTTKLRGELPGILLWAIAGWQRLRERGSSSSPSGTEMLDGMADLSSPVGSIRERCLVGPDTGPLPMTCLRSG